ncbi:hypothetical protein [Micromonospora sp. NBS 11-29]|uniref:hypothetical protein n=1 Tax=Micromonospora sp. NBS 11-29 TaxID=1960879 RepID=UPI001121E517|nr:hypothetical protein [Micromonospora sp. NBS 11-29]
MTVLVTPLLLATAACATSAARAEPGRQPAPVVSYWPGQEEVMDAAGRVDEAAPARWPDRYAGIATDFPGRAVIVHRVPGGGIDGDVRALAGGVTVRFVDAVEPATTIDRWMGRVRADIDWWADRGVIVWSVAPRFGDCVVLEVDRPAEQSAEITRHYSDMRVCVEQGSEAVPLPAARPDRSGLTDATPELFG